MRRGATVAELVIATLILGAALVPIYSIFTSSNKAAGASKLAYMSAQVAREMIEELRTIPFDKLEDQKVDQPKAITGGLFATSSKARSIGSQDANNVAGANAPQYPDEYKRIKYTLKIDGVDNTGIPQAITGAPPKARLKKVTLDVFWEEQGGVGEKSRPGLQRYVTFVGNHSVDPEVPE